MDLDETDIVNIDETDILINLAHKRLRNVVFRRINGVSLYYCENGLYVANIDCDGEQAFVFVCAKSPFQAADKIKKIIKVEWEEK